MIETLARVEDLQDVPRTTIGDPEAFFARAGRRGAVARGRRRALPRVPPRHLHDAGAHQAGEPARGAGAARRRAARGRRRMSRGRARSSIGAWQTLLLNHFHDILPGSSIGEVHERAERDLAEVEATAGAMRDRFLVGEVVNTVGVGAPRGRRDERRPALRGGAVVRRRAGSSRPAPRCASHEDGDEFVLENEHLRAVLGRDGTLRSLVETATGREAMAAPGNVLELYEDRPTAFEAWDLDPFHLETRSDCPPASSAEVALADPLRAEVAFERPIGRAQPHAPDRAPRRGVAAPRVPLRDRLARGPPRAEGPLPGRRPRAPCDLRDAVRRRRAPDALLDAPRPRPVRGPRPSLRRPLRARLRRRAALGCDLRLVRSRRGHAHDPPALAALAGPRGRRRPPRPLLRHPAPSRRLAGRPASPHEALCFNAPLLLGERERRESTRGCPRTPPAS